MLIIFQGIIYFAKNSFLYEMTYRIDESTLGEEKFIDILSFKEFSTLTESLESCIWWIWLFHGISLNNTIMERTNFLLQRESPFFDSIFIHILPDNDDDLEDHHWWRAIPFSLASSRHSRIGYNNVRAARAHKNRIFAVSPSLQLYLARHWVSLA